MKVENRYIKLYVGSYIGSWVMFLKFFSRKMNLEFNIIPKNYSQFYKRVSKSKINIRIYNLSIFQLIIENKKIN